MKVFFSITELFYFQKIMPLIKEVSLLMEFHGQSSWNSALRVD